MTDSQPEPLTAGDHELLQALRKASTERQRRLWCLLMAARNGLAVEEARHVAGREPSR